MIDPARRPKGTVAQTCAVSRRRGAGLTVIEVLVAIVAIATILFVLLFVLGGPRGSRSSARQIKCATQVRWVIQAMTIFTNSNDGRYPLPSRGDPDNVTVSQIGRAKDTMANTLSILCFYSSISPELLVSPSESNSKIKVHTGYQNVNPSTAVNPAKAFWDPSLSADFTAGEAHISYAMLMTDGVGDEKTRTASGRLQHWANTFDPAQACFGNRGPQVTGRDAAGNILYNKLSNTLAIHGGRTTWEGNIGYNDNHVNFEKVMDPKPVEYRVAGGKFKADILFYDEPDNTDGLNTCLGVWIKAGEKPSDFKGIHD